MVGVPVIINHKDITADNANAERVGVVSNVWFDEKDGWYWCDGVIWDETAQNLITDKGWSVSCSYDVKLADDAGGTENNIPYDIEFLDGVFTHLAIVDNPRYERANIVFNSKTVINNQFREEEHPRDENGRFTDGDKSNKNKEQYLSGENVYDNFVDIHKAFQEKEPPPWNGQSVQEALDYLGIKDGNGIKIKSPIEEISIYKSHMEHLIDENNAYRKKYLNRALRTIQAPNLILKSGNYKNYLKIFSDEQNKIKPHLQIVKTKEDGNFYVTTMKPTKNQVKKIILEGQVIYDLSSMSSTKSTDTNIVTNSSTDFNPDVKIHEANKEQDMALLEELKKLITKVENDKGEDMDDEKKIENEKVDKRKLIDEVAGIMKSAGADDEKIRTAIAKMEKLAYDKSEAGTADNEKEDGEDEKEDKADNKKVKNEETKEDKKEYEDLKKDVKKDVENKCKNSVNNSNGGYFEKMNEIYNSAIQVKEENRYISRTEKLKNAEEYFSK